MELKRVPTDGGPASLVALFRHVSLFAVSLFTVFFCIASFYIFTSVSFLWGAHGMNWRLGVVRRAKKHAEPSVTAQSASLTRSSAFRQLQANRCRPLIMHPLSLFPLTLETVQCSARASPLARYSQSDLFHLYLVYKWPGVIRHEFVPSRPNNSRGAKNKRLGNSGFSAQLLMRPSRRRDL